MNALLWWVGEAVLLGLGWCVFTWVMGGWKRRADELAALYG